MGLLDNIPHDKEITRHRPWPRAVVADAGWKNAIDLLADGRCTLLGLWGDTGDVHMALLDEKAGDIAVSATRARTASIRVSASGIRRQSGSNAPSVTCSVPKPSAR